MHDGSDFGSNDKENGTSVAQVNVNQLRKLVDKLASLQQCRKPGLRVAEASLIMGILSACGGGGTQSSSDNEPSSPSSGGSDSSDSGGSLGYVIDGYVSGARVFSDANGNNRFDSGELFAITNSSGAFDSSAFTDLQNVNLVADDNSGNAIDTATGLPLTLTMSAPGSYQVITPITTLIAAISGKGYSLDAAEEIVSSAFQLNNSIDFSTFDPFGSSATPQTEVAEAYQVLAMKVANIIMASDGDFQVNSFAGYTEAVARFADLVILKNNLSQTVDLTDLNQLRQLLPSADEDLLATLQTSNGVNSFNELLDSQLVLQSANSLGQIQLPTGDGTVLVAVEISGILSDSDVYRLTLENADGF